MAGEEDKQKAEKNDKEPLLPSDNEEVSTDNVPWYKRRGVLWAAVGTVVGAPVAIVAAPIVVAGMGFGAGGIVAGSYVASMMSAAAIANGGAVAAGSSVAILQSIGAAGFGLAGLMGVGAAGAGVGAGVGAAVGAVADAIQNNGNAGDDGADAEAGSNGTNPMGQQPNADGTDSAGSTKVTSDLGAVNKDSAKNGENARANGVNIELVERQPNDETAIGKMELIIMDSSGNNHRFTVTWDEPLRRVFAAFLGILGLAPGTVRFELNRVQLNGHDTPRTINWKIGDVVDAVLL